MHLKAAFRRLLQLLLPAPTASHSSTKRRNNRPCLSRQVSMINKTAPSSVNEDRAKRAIAAISDKYFMSTQFVGSTLTLKY
jgi:hypothetical protein